MSYCIHCGTEIHSSYEFCPECGSCISIRQTNQNCYSPNDNRYKICPRCKEQMPEDAFYCLSCGTTFGNNEYDFETIKNCVVNSGKAQQGRIATTVGVWKNKWISLILCIFFGVFGIHRFYEEKKVTGFIFLFSFGLCGLGWFFDIILLTTKPNPYRVK